MVAEVGGQVTLLSQPQCPHLQNEGSHPPGFLGGVTEVVNLRGLAKSSLRDGDYSGASAFRTSPAHLYSEDGDPTHHSGHQDDSRK